MGNTEPQTASTLHLHSYNSLYFIMCSIDGMLSERVD